jgi:alkylation response protein AidB-like acyl-CoA dehydrogenase
MSASDLPAPVMRDVAELLAGADASTWFVWTQHHTPVRTVRRGTNTELRERLLAPLLAGTTLAGVAYTHLRRPGPPALTATLDGGEWRLNGDIAWLTSWELADVFCVGAQVAGRDDDLVWMLPPLRDLDGVRAEPLGLAAMAGTSTFRVRLDNVRVDVNDVALVEPLAEWRVTDAARTADVSPAVLGVAEEAVRRLHERGDPVTAGVADAISEQLAAVRSSAYTLIDDVEAGEQIDERLRLRAHAHLLAIRATTALVTVGAGRAMLLDSAAQRLARVALFLLVQGQTAAVREATLHELTLH